MDGGIIPQISPVVLESLSYRHQAPPRLSFFSRTPPIVFCPADIVTGKSVRAGGVFEKGVSGDCGQTKRYAGFSRVDGSRFTESV
jgi:hypothetical protein